MSFLASVRQEKGWGGLKDHSACGWRMMGKKKKEQEEKSEGTGKGAGEEEDP